ncbi:hypothetical protein TNCV_3249551 [Trichonephila clavipes]|nr:hypothetical protein TNCV_3249551 [Trichonephila clavipes]
MRVVQSIIGLLTPTDLARNGTAYRPENIQKTDRYPFKNSLSWYLNPIENVWDALGRQVAGRNYPPTNNNTLIRALTEEWDKLPQRLLLDNVVQTDGSTYQCGITLHGGHIRTDTFLLNRCLLPFRCIVPFLRTQIK